MQLTQQAVHRDIQRPLPFQQFEVRIMKFVAVIFLLSIASAYGQDAGTIAIQQANDQALMATQTALQMQQQALQTTLMTNQIMQTNDIGNFPESSGPVVGVALEPTFSVKPGKIEPGTLVRIKSATHYATIYYTTDGWTPTAASARYTGPIPVNANLHVQAIAIGPNLLHSSVARADYWVTAPSVAAPAASIKQPALVTDGVLRAGTPLRLKVAAEVSSSTAQVGDKVPLLLDQDLKVGDTVVAAEGTPVDAILIAADPASKHNVPGDLVFKVRTLTAAGKTIPLTGGQTLEGQGGRNPKNAVIDPGLTLIAIVAKDTPLQP